MTHPPEREIGSELTGALHHSTGSYELVIAALAAAGLGFWIDSVLGIRPVLTLIFAFAGFIGAGYSIYLKYQTDMAEATEARTARVNAPTATLESAAKARARDERVSGAERNAPPGSPAFDSYLAETLSEPNPSTVPTRVRAEDNAASKAEARDERVSGAERNAPTEDSVLRANVGFDAKQESKSKT